MRLTRAPRDASDDLAAAIHERFGAPAAAVAEAPAPAAAQAEALAAPAAEEGDTLLPAINEAEQIAQRLEALKGWWDDHRVPAPPAPAPAEQPHEPAPLPVAEEFPAPPGPAAAVPSPEPAPDPSESTETGKFLPPPPPPGDIPAPMRFASTAHPPPPTPFDDLGPGELAPPVQEAPAVPPESHELPDPDVTVHKRASVLDRPAPVGEGVVKIKKSSEKKGRKLFAKREKSPISTPTASRKPSAVQSGPTPVAEALAPYAGDPAGAPQPAEDEAAGPRHKGTPLGELLIGRGLVSEDQLREALSTQTGSGKRLGNILVELGLLSERVLVEVLAEQLQLEIVDLSKMDLDRDVVTLLPEFDARRLIAVPVKRDGAWIEVAVADPLRENLREQLIELLASPVRLVFATATDIDAVINKMHAHDVDLGDALRMFEAKLEKRKTSKETETNVTTVVDENAPVVKVVNLILEQAVRERASDIHIEPMEQIVRIRARTDGALHQVMTLPSQMGPSLISRIKVMSDMNIVERRKPQDGQLAVNVAGRELDVRVSTTPTVFGEKCVLRVLDKTKAVIDLPGLGMAPETYNRYSDLIRSPYGMVICAGPTGSGKTTTLYATLTAINNEDINVVTVEDPVEYVFPEINQIPINEASGLTFASGLRAILRQDPDAILVGEIRDVETARIAVQAA